MSRPAKPTTCPVCHTVLGQNKPVYHTVTTELYKVRKWIGSGFVETGETGNCYRHWYTCEACARKAHPDFFPTAESLKPLLDKVTANPDDWEASWHYKNAKQLHYLEHRQCVWCNRPIWEKNDYRFLSWRRMGQSCCSPNCTNAQAYARRAERTKLYRTPKEATCLCCHKRFVPTRCDAQFCSNACRQKHYRSPKP